MVSGVMMVMIYDKERDLIIKQTYQLCVSQQPNSNSPASISDM